MAIKGSLVSTAAFRGFGPAVVANQAAPTYGPLASPPTSEMDGFLVAVSNGAGAVTIADQNGQSTTFGTGTLIAGQVYPMSVSQFVTVTASGATLVPLYR